MRLENTRNPAVGDDPGHNRVHGFVKHLNHLLLNRPRPRWQHQLWSHATASVIGAQWSECLPQRLTVLPVREATTPGPKSAWRWRVWVNPESIDKEDRPMEAGQLQSNNRDQRLPVATAIRSIRFW